MSTGDEGRASEWIGVAEVAEEMHWSKKTAYEDIRRLGVPVRGRGVDNIRFLRSEYTRRRDGALAPLSPWGEGRAAAPAAGPGAITPRPQAAPAAPARASKLRALRVR